MCLSTAYLNHKDENMIAARFVDSIQVDGKKVVLRDVMGAITEIEGVVTYVDLTGGAVIISTEAN